MFQGSSVPYSTVLQATKTTLHKLAAHAGSKLENLTVTANGGHTASVKSYKGWNGRPVITVNMPTLPPGAILTRTEADRMVGYLLHELGHVLFSDMDLWRKEACDDALLFQVINGLEDPREERAVITSGFAPGAADLFASLMEHVTADAVRKGWQCRKLGDLPFAFAVFCRRAFGYPIPSAAGLKVAPAMRPLIDAAIAGLPSCQSTADVIALAKRLVGEARKVAAEQPAPAKAGKGAKGDKAKAGKGDKAEGADKADSADNAEGKAEGAGKGDKAEGDKAEGDKAGKGDKAEGADSAEGKGAASEGAEGAEGDKGEGDGEGDSAGRDSGADSKGDGAEGKGSGGHSAGAGDSTDETISKSGDLDVADVFKTIARREGAVDPGTMHASLANWDGMTVERPSTYRLPATPSQVATVRQRIAAPARLVSAVRRMLRAPDEIGRQTFLTSGRLDRRAITRIQAGAQNVFARREDVPAINTGVLLLLDNSGSMSGTRNAAAQAMALHLGEACAAAGAQVCIATFVRGGNSLRVIKDWTEGKAQIANAACKLGTGGGTPLSQSIMAGVDYLRQRPHLTRRVMLSLTDGACNYGRCGVEWACQYAKVKGVEHVGLCLETSDWQSLGFDAGVKVADAKDLSGAALGALAAQLEKKGRAHAGRG